MSVRRFAWMVVASVAVVGCGVELEFLTEAPPTKTASISAPSGARSDGQITLSSGIAVVAHCFDSCESGCKSPKLTSSSRTVIEVRDVAGTPAPLIGGASITDPLFLLVAGAPGEAKLDVESSCGTASYRVTVE